MPDFYKLARKILFRFDPETAHHLTLDGMVWAHRLGLLSVATGSCCRSYPVSSEITAMGLRFPNRVGLAAGLDKAGTAVAAFGALGFGHVEIGTVTPRPQPGNPQPRLFRLVEHEAIINRMGFNNPGTAALLENVARSRRGFSGVLGFNIGYNFDTPNERALDDYLACYRAVYVAADYVTANLSSPNTKGLRNLQGRTLLAALLGQVMEARLKLARPIPVFLKIAPDLSAGELEDIVDVALAAKVAGIIATNTTLQREGLKSASRGEVGGLSGAPLFEKSTRVLARLSQLTHGLLPLIGVGGVGSAEQAYEKIRAGATAVQLYTAMVYQGISLVPKVATGLDALLARDGYANVALAVGTGRSAWL